MNTLWLKVAAVAVAAVVVIVVISHFVGRGDNGNEGDSHTVVTVEPEPPKPKTYGDVIREDDKRLRAEAPPVAQKTFRQLTEEESTGASQLYEMAIFERKAARLPGMNYSRMVEYCRMIIERYPNSEYDYKSRRMLAEVPRSQWDRYRITQQEIDGTVTVPPK